MDPSVTVITSSPRFLRLGTIATLLAGAAYCVVVHVLIVDLSMPSTTLLVISAPWLMALGSVSLTETRTWSTSRTTTVVITGFTVASASFCLWELGKALGGRVDLPIFAESFVFLVSLGVLFGSSLVADREALVTRLARIARQGDMTPAVILYTRRVTAAWALFFALMAGVSAVLFTTQSREVWSAFVNLALWPLTAAGFAIEYVVRLRVLPDIRHESPMAGVRAFMHRDDGDSETARSSSMDSAR
jgi:uncharacterized membrane protein